MLGFVLCSLRLKFSIFAKMSTSTMDIIVLGDKVCFCFPAFQLALSILFPTAKGISLLPTAECRLQQIVLVATSLLNKPKSPATNLLIANVWGINKILKIKRHTLT